MTPAPDGVTPIGNNADVNYDSKITSQIPSEVAERLGPYFVYALVDPGDKEIFYIGKGTQGRPTAHGGEAMLVADKDPSTQSAKQAKINSIRSAGREPDIEIMRHGLSEDEALLVEAALIDGIGLDSLTNAVRGHSTEQGRTSLKELKYKYGATDVDDDAPRALVISLSKWVDEPDALGRKGWGYKPDATDQEIVDATRAWWKVSPTRVEREGINYAVALHNGVSRAVMEIGEWQRNKNGRWAFEATPITEGPIFDKWVGPLGKRIDKGKAQNPVLYWPFNSKDQSKIDVSPGRLVEPTQIPEVAKNAPPALVIRLGPWKDDPNDPLRKGFGWKPTASYQEVVDAARAWWKISPERVEREGIRYAVAFHQGVSRAVMEIGEWQQNEHGRWAFEAKPITSGAVFNKWVGSLGKRITFKKGAQSPVLYWPFK